MKGLKIKLGMRQSWFGHLEVIHIEIRYTEYINIFQCYDINGIKIP